MKKRNDIGPLDSIFSIFSIPAWPTVAIPWLLGGWKQNVREIAGMAQGIGEIFSGGDPQPVDASIEIHGGDIPTAWNILQDHGILSGHLLASIPNNAKFTSPVWYPATPYKRIKIPRDKVSAVLASFDQAGIRYRGS